MDSSYAEKTFADPNPLKRFAHRRRLRDALGLITTSHEPRRVLDFGAGNGELLKRAVEIWPGAELMCYEPDAGRMNQAREHLAGVPGVSFLDSTDQLSGIRADTIFCLEVFEHLPEPESDEAFGHMRRLLGATGQAVISVPIETGLPALVKGLFRMMRRYGEFDAQARRIARAVLARPVSGRPRVRLESGSDYYLHHLGFDHREFERKLATRFRILKHCCSPMGVFGPALNFEISYLIESRDEDGPTPT